jgi:hypothetical protein
VPEKHGPQHQIFNRSDLLSRRFYSTCRNRPSSTYLHTGIWRVTRIQAAYRRKFHQRQHIAQSRSSYTRKRDRYCRPYCRENLKAGAALSCSFVMLRTAWSGNGRARTVSKKALSAVGCAPSGDWSFCLGPVDGAVLAGV